MTNSVCSRQFGANWTKVLLRVEQWSRPDPVQMHPQLKPGADVDACVYTVGRTDRRQNDFNSSDQIHTEVSGSPGSERGLLGGRGRR